VNGEIEEESGFFGKLFGMWRRESPEPVRPDDVPQPNPDFLQPYLAPSAYQDFAKSVVPGVLPSQVVPRYAESSKHRQDAGRSDGLISNLLFNFGGTVESPAQQSSTQPAAGPGVQGTGAGETGSSSTTSASTTSLRTVDLSRKYWMSDKSCTVCYNCGKDFTFFRRRHHCRLCGQIFCQSCSSNTINGSRYNLPGTVRVCDDCFHVATHEAAAVAAHAQEQALQQQRLLQMQEAKKKQAQAAASAPQSASQSSTTTVDPTSTRFLQSLAAIIAPTSASTVVQSQAQQSMVANDGNVTNATTAPGTTPAAVGGSTVQPSSKTSNVPSILFEPRKNNLKSTGSDPLDPRYRSESHSISRASDSSSAVTTTPSKMGLNRSMRDRAGPFEEELSSGSISPSGSDEETEEDADDTSEEDDDEEDEEEEADYAMVDFESSDDEGERRVKVRQKIQQASEKSRSPSKVPEPLNAETASKPKARRRSRPFTKPPPLVVDPTAPTAFIPQGAALNNQPPELGSKVTANPAKSSPADATSSTLLRSPGAGRAATFHSDWSCTVRARRESLLLNRAVGAIPKSSSPTMAQQESTQTSSPTVETPSIYDVAADDTGAHGGRTRAGSVCSPSNSVSLEGPEVRQSQRTYSDSDLTSSIDDSPPALLKFSCRDLRLLVRRELPFTPSGKLHRFARVGRLLFSADPLFEGAAYEATCQFAQSHDKPAHLLSSWRAVCASREVAILEKELPATALVALRQTLQQDFMLSLRVLDGLNAGAIHRSPKGHAPSRPGSRAHLIVNTGGGRRACLADLVDAALWLTAVRNDFADSDSSTKPASSTHKANVERESSRLAESTQAIDSSIDTMPVAANKDPHLAKLLTFPTGSAADKGRESPFAPRPDEAGTVLTPEEGRDRLALAADLHLFKLLCAMLHADMVFRSEPVRPGVDLKTRVEKLVQNVIRGSGETFETSGASTGFSPQILENIERRAIDTIQKSLDSIDLDPPIGYEWLDVIWSLTRLAVNRVQPNTRFGDKLSAADYVSIKVIPGGSIQDCQYIDGTVIAGQPAHKKMKRRIVDPRVLLLSCAIEYDRTGMRFASIDSLRSQETEYLSLQVAKIMSAKPDVVVVQRSVALEAQHMLLRHGVTVISNVPEAQMRKLARALGGVVLASTDYIDLNAVRVSSCSMFRCATVDASSALSVDLVGAIYSAASEVLGEDQPNSSQSMIPKHVSRSKQLRLRMPDSSFFIDEVAGDLADEERADEAQLLADAVGTVATKRKRDLRQLKPQALDSQMTSLSDLLTPEPNSPNVPDDGYPSGEEEIGEVRSTTLDNVAKVALTQTGSVRKAILAAASAAADPYAAAVTAAAGVDVADADSSEDESSLIVTPAKRFGQIYPNPSPRFGSKREDGMLKQRGDTLTLSMGRALAQEVLDSRRGVKASRRLTTVRAEEYPLEMLTRAHPRGQPAVATRSYCYFEGSDPVLYGTIVLRGAPLRMLYRIRAIIRNLIYCAHSLRSESAALHDLCASYRMEDLDALVRSLPSYLLPDAYRLGLVPPSALVGAFGPRIFARPPPKSREEKTQGSSAPTNVSEMLRTTIGSGARLTMEERRRKGWRLEGWMQLYWGRLLESSTPELSIDCPSQTITSADITLTPLSAEERYYEALLLEDLAGLEDLDKLQPPPAAPAPLPWPRDQAFLSGALSTSPFVSESARVNPKILYRALSKLLFQSETAIEAYAARILSTSSASSTGSLASAASAATADLFGALGAVRRAQSSPSSEGGLSIFRGSGPAASLGSLFGFGSSPSSSGVRQVSSSTDMVEHDPSSANSSFTHEGRSIGTPGCSAALVALQAARLSQSAALAAFASIGAGSRVAVMAPPNSTGTLSIASFPEWINAPVRALPGALAGPAADAELAVEQSIAAKSTRASFGHVAYMSRLAAAIALVAQSVANNLNEVDGKGSIETVAQGVRLPDTRTPEPARLVVETRKEQATPQPGLASTALAWIFGKSDTPGNSEIPHSNKLNAAEHPGLSSMAGSPMDLATSTAVAETKNLPLSGASTILGVGVPGADGTFYVDAPNGYAVTIGCSGAFATATVYSGTGATTGATGVSASSVGQVGVNNPAQPSSTSFAAATALAAAAVVSSSGSNAGGGASVTATGSATLGLANSYVSFAPGFGLAGALHVLSAVSAGSLQILAVAGAPVPLVVLDKVIGHAVAPVNSVNVVSSASRRATQSMAGLLSGLVEKNSESLGRSTDQKRIYPLGLSPWLTNPGADLHPTLMPFKPSASIALRFGSLHGYRKAREALPKVAIDALMQRGSSDSLAQMGGSIPLDDKILYSVASSLKFGPTTRSPHQRESQSGHTRPSNLLPHHQDNITRPVDNSLQENSNRLTSEVNLSDLVGPKTRAVVSSLPLIPDISVMAFEDGVDGTVFIMPAASAVHLALTPASRSNALRKGRKYPYNSRWTRTHETSELVVLPSRRPFGGAFSLDEDEIEMPSRRSAVRRVSLKQRALQANETLQQALDSPSSERMQETIPEVPKSGFVALHMQQAGYGAYPDDDQALRGPSKSVESHNPRQRTSNPDDADSETDAECQVTPANNIMGQLRAALKVSEPKDQNASSSWNGPKVTMIRSPCLPMPDPLLAAAAMPLVPVISDSSLPLPAYVSCRFAPLGSEPPVVVDSLTHTSASTASAVYLVNPVCLPSSKYFPSSSASLAAYKQARAKALRAAEEQLQFQTALHGFMSIDDYALPQLEGGRVSASAEGTTSGTRDNLHASVSAIGFAAKLILDPQHLRTPFGDETGEAMCDADIDLLSASVDIADVDDSADETGGETDEEQMRSSRGHLRRKWHSIMAQHHSLWFSRPRLHESAVTPDSTASDVALINKHRVKTFANLETIHAPMPRLMGQSPVAGHDAAGMPLVAHNYETTPAATQLIAEAPTQDPNTLWCSDLQPNIQLNLGALSLKDQDGSQIADKANKGIEQSQEAAKLTGENVRKAPLPSLTSQDQDKGVETLQSKFSTTSSRALEDALMAMRNNFDVPTDVCPSSDPGCLWVQRRFRFSTCWVCAQTQRAFPATLRETEFFGPTDKTLGQFLTQGCLNLKLKCLNSECRKDVLHHSLGFIHPQGRVIVDIRRLPESSLPDVLRDPSKLASLAARSTPYTSSAPNYLAKPSIWARYDAGLGTKLMDSETLHQQLGIDAPAGKKKHRHLGSRTGSIAAGEDSHTNAEATCAWNGLHPTALPPWESEEWLAKSDEDQTEGNYDGSEPIGNRDRSNSDEDSPPSRMIENHDSDLELSDSEDSRCTDGFSGNTSDSHLSTAYLNVKLSTSESLQTLANFCDVKLRVVGSRQPKLALVTEPDDRLQTREEAFTTSLDVPPVLTEADLIALSAEPGTTNPQVCDVQKTMLATPKALIMPKSQRKQLLEQIEQERRSYLSSLANPLSPSLHSPSSPTNSKRKSEGELADTIERAVLQGSGLCKSLEDWFAARPYSLPPKWIRTDASSHLDAPSARAKARHHFAYALGAKPQEFAQTLNQQRVVREAKAARGEDGIGWMGRYSPPARHSIPVLMWAGCKACRKGVTPYVVMSRETYQLSLSKYLEMTFLNHRARWRTSPCHHSASKHHVRFFAVRDIVVSIHFDAVSPFHIVAPPLLSVPAPKRAVSAVYELQGLAHVAYAMFQEFLFKIAEFDSPGPETTQQLDRLRHAVTSEKDFFTMLLLVLGFDRAELLIAIPESKKRALEQQYMNQVETHAAQVSQYEASLAKYKEDYAAYELECERLRQAYQQELGICVGGGDGGTTAEDGTTEVKAEPDTWGKSQDHALESPPDSAKASTANSLVLPAPPRRPIPPPPPPRKQKILTLQTLAATPGGQRLDLFDIFKLKRHIARVFQDWNGQLADIQNTAQLEVKRKALEALKLQQQQQAQLQMQQMQQYKALRDTQIRLQQNLTTVGSPSVTPLVSSASHGSLVPPLSKSPSPHPQSPLLTNQDPGMPHASADSHLALPPSTTPEASMDNGSVSEAQLGERVDQQLEMTPAADQSVLAPDEPKAVEPSSISFSVPSTSDKVAMESGDDVSLSRDTSNYESSSTPTGSPPPTVPLDNAEASLPKEVPVLQMKVSTSNLSANSEPQHSPTPVTNTSANRPIGLSAFAISRMLDPPPVAAATSSLIVTPDAILKRNPRLHPDGVAFLEHSAPDSTVHLFLPLSAGAITVPIDEDETGTAIAYALAHPALLGVVYEGMTPFVRLNTELLKERRRSILESLVGSTKKDESGLFATPDSTKSRGQQVTPTTTLPALKESLTDTEAPPSVPPSQDSVPSEPQISELSKPAIESMPSVKQEPLETSSTPDPMASELKRAALQMLQLAAKEELKLPMTLEQIASYAYLILAHGSVLQTPIVTQPQAAVPAANVQKTTPPSSTAPPPHQAPATPRDQPSLSSAVGTPDISSKPHSLSPADSSAGTPSSVPAHLYTTPLAGKTQSSDERVDTVGDGNTANRIGQKERSNSPESPSKISTPLSFRVLPPNVDIYSVRDVNGVDDSVLVSPIKGLTNLASDPDPSKARIGQGSSAPSTSSGAPQSTQGQSGGAHTVQVLSVPKVPVIYNSNTGQYQEEPGIAIYSGVRFTHLRTSSETMAPYIRIIVDDSPRTLRTAAASLVPQQGVNSVTNTISERTRDAIADDGTQSLESLHPTDHESMHSQVASAAITSPVSVFREDRYSNATSFSCHVYFPREFHALRAQLMLGDYSLIASLAKVIRHTASGGKSGSTFSKTSDNRFLLKYVSATEFHMFLQTAPAYFEYMSRSIFKNMPSLLVKILGAFSITARKGGKKTPTKYVFLMPNVFYGFTAQQVFDLKGSVSANRETKKRNRADPGRVLLDLDFIKAMGGFPVVLDEVSRSFLRTAIYNDTTFLASLGFIDYSVLVGIDNLRGEISAGIIDYVRQYTWDKRLETGVKSVGLIAGKALPTIIPPPEYKIRFRLAMDRYFVAAPIPLIQPDLPTLMRTRPRGGDLMPTTWSPRESAFAWRRALATPRPSDLKVSCKICRERVLDSFLADDKETLAKFRNDLEVENGLQHTFGARHVVPAWGSDAVDFRYFQLANSARGGSCACAWSTLTNDEYRDYRLVQTTLNRLLALYPDGPGYAPVLSDGLGRRLRRRQNAELQIFGHRLQKAMASPLIAVETNPQTLSAVGAAPETPSPVADIETEEGVFIPGSLQSTINKKMQTPSRTESPTIGSSHMPRAAVVRSVVSAGSSNWIPSTLVTARGTLLVGADAPTCRKRVAKSAFAAAVQTDADSEHGGAESLPSLEAKADVLTNRELLSDLDTRVLRRAVRTFVDEDDCDMVDDAAILCLPAAAAAVKTSVYNTTPTVRTLETQPVVDTNPTGAFHPRN